MNNMEIPKEDKIHVLNATIASNGKFFTAARAATALIYALLFGFTFTLLLLPWTNSIIIVMGGPWVILFFALMWISWPFSVTRKDWLMWKATRQEG